jgi:hypothetical protein
MLTGQLDGTPVTIAVLDHPSNPAHPTYWHARTWGLFAANPLGQKIFSGGKETLAFALPQGKSARFSYRVLILTHHATAQEIEEEYRSFARQAGAEAHPPGRSDGERRGGQSVGASAVAESVEPPPSGEAPSEVPPSPALPPL